MVKKSLLSLALVGFLALVIFALPAHAQNIDPCPRDAGGDFSSLCNLDKSTLTDLIRNGITILFIIATIASLFFLIFGGIKWISSGGDKGKLEESRNMLVAAAVGLIITFSSYFILNLVLGLFGLPTVNRFRIPSLTESAGSPSAACSTDNPSGSCPAGKTCTRQDHSGDVFWACE